MVGKARGKQVEKQGSGSPGVPLAVCIDGILLSERSRVDIRLAVDVVNDGHDILA